MRTSFRLSDVSWQTQITRDVSAYKEALYYA